MKSKRVLFQGEEYVLTGGDLARGGAIATKENLTAFRESFAHLMADGRVLRHGRVIGHREDIEILGDSDTEPTLQGFLENALNPEAWPRLFGQQE